MRTTIDIDDDLMRLAMRGSGAGCRVGVSAISSSLAASYWATSAVTPSGFPVRDAPASSLTTEWLNTLVVAHLSGSSALTAISAGG